mmetsp:Transcript_74905/g.243336  ORF Transcript_74905/g.243336 Transcript_74905/m.243336 type:complete len:219 (+) Transcript_74905:1394-2050(+)
MADEVLMKVGDGLHQLPANFLGALLREGAAVRDLAEELAALAILGHDPSEAGSASTLSENASQLEQVQRAIALLLEVSQDADLGQRVLLRGRSFLGQSQEDAALIGLCAFESRQLLVPHLLHCEALIRLVPAPHDVPGDTAGDLAQHCEVAGWQLREGGSIWPEVRHVGGQSVLVVFPCSLEDSACGFHSRRRLGGMARLAAAHGSGAHGGWSTRWWY